MVNVEGLYFYQLFAYYSAIDCTSAPASLKDDPNKFALPVYYSPTDVEETENSLLNLYPNPAKQSLSIEAEGMTHVTVYNLLGQMVYDADCNSNMMNISVFNWNEGIYMVKVKTAKGMTSQRISIVH